jgi:hypothetical protein
VATEHRARLRLLSPRWDSSILRLRRCRCPSQALAPLALDVRPSGARRPPVPQGLRENPLHKPWRVRTKQSQ